MMKRFLCAGFLALLAWLAAGLSAQSFQNYRTITATNAGATVQTDYQVLVELNVGNFNYANVQGANGEDIRFFATAANGGAALDYFIESWNNTGTSLIWVEVPNIPASGSVDFEMHYNDAGTTTSASNFAATFPNAYVSSGSATLTGTQSYDWFEVQAADTITVGAGSPFVVNARRIIVAGTINGAAAGHQAPASSNNGTGPGGGIWGTSSGASGGGYGGAGGDGGYDSGDPIQAGGVAYGAATDVLIDMGSSGGSASTTVAGSGGGAVDLRGYLVNVSGSINCSGGLAQQPGGGQGSGGGAGGGILIGGYDIVVSATLTADGGGGSIGTSTANDDGGGGGGGRIKVFYENTGADTSTTSVVGGPGGVNGGASPGLPGSAGTVHSAQDTTVIEEVTSAVGSEQTSNPGAPTLALATGSTFVTGSNFDLALDPGTTLGQASLEADDPSPDPLDISITFLTGAMGATPPTNITAPAGGTGITALPFLLTWTGTVDANDAPGTYTWEVSLDDGTSLVTFDVNLIINDLDPTHTAAAGITGDGTTTGTAYATTVQIGSSTAINIADLADANLSQSVTLASDTETAAPGSATMTFNWSVTGANPATLVATPSAAPALADVGSFDYTVVIEDDNNNQVTLYVTISVDGTAPTITSAAAPTQAPDGGSFSHQFTATGNPSPTFAVTTGTLPAWANLTPAGLLSGTPVLGQDINVTVSAQNGIAPDATEVVNVTVVAGVAPAITSAAAPTSATVGSLYTHTFTATGTPTPTLSATGLPAWLTFTPATGVLSGTPAAGDVGTTGTITITAANGVTPDATEAFTITVNTSGGGSGGGGGDGGGGCTVGTGGLNWLAVLCLLCVVTLALRVRVHKE